mmetsp:Transcript_28937/g.61445  ORF Transcript_28937/g.61445 Transcript_28937/m.61445 type:complete len:215 (-) Transcript_28937:202-846(-)
MSDHQHRTSSSKVGSYALYPEREEPFICVTERFGGRHEGHIIANAADLRNFYIQIVRICPFLFLPSMLQNSDPSFRTTGHIYPSMVLHADRCWIEHTRSAAVALLHNSHWLAVILPSPSLHHLQRHWRRRNIPGIPPSCQTYLPIQTLCSLFGKTDKSTVMPFVQSPTVYYWYQIMIFRTWWCGVFFSFLRYTHSFCQVGFFKYDVHRIARSFE